MSFSIGNKNQDGFAILILKDDLTQSLVEIIPACGAILHGFSILKNGAYLNLIEQYKSFDDFKTNVENKGFKSCKLSPFACRIKDAAYTFNHQKYRLNKFILNGSALHGLLYDAEFVVTHQETTPDYSAVTLLHQYRATDKGYPFNYDCRIEYRLTKDNQLHIETTLTNKDELSIPVQDGWHPYFTFNKPINDLQLKIKTKEKIELDASLIPTGKTIPYHNFENFRTIDDTAFDDCFVITGTNEQPACILKDTAQNVQVEIYPDKTYPYLQLYTPGNRSSMAIENLSALPDAFNNQIGLITLHPQSSKKFTTTYKITSLK